MKSLIVLVCSVLVVTNCQDASVIVIGSKYIRPKQPYTVAFANPLSTSVKLSLSLQCQDDDDKSVLLKNSTLQLKRQSATHFKYDVPDIVKSRCFFSAVNDGGSVEVNHEVDLLFPEKTLSMFILTDKPVYKPGDVVRFQVVVLDIALKPAKHIKSVEIKIEDTNDESRRQWTQAKLHNGLFESSYQLASVPALGMWKITVTANDNSAVNVKSQQFEIREYVVPKFAVKVAPSRTLLIEDREISLHVASHYTFGEPVQGKILVELYTNSKFPRATHSDSRQFDGTGSFTFRLRDELNPEDDADYFNLKVNVSVTEKFSNFTTVVTKFIPVFKNPYKISLIKPAMNYRPGAEYFCKVSVKDHYGIPVEPMGRSVTLKTTEDEQTAELDNQGIATFVLRMPDEATKVEISAEFENVEYEKIEEVEGLDTASNQYLQVIPKNRIIAGKSVTFSVSSNEVLSQLYYVVVSRGSIVLFGQQKVNRKKTHALKLKLSAEMAPQARLLVYTVQDGLLIMDFLELDFESFANEFEYMLDELDGTYRPDQDIYVDVTAEKDSFVAFQAIDQGVLLLGHDQIGLTKESVLEDLDKYVRDSDNSMDLINSMGLFSRHEVQDLQSGSSRMRRSARRSKRQIIKKPVFLRTEFPEAWLWNNFTMNNRPTHTLSDVVPDSITSWYVTGFALSPSRGLGLMSAPQKFTVSKPFYMIANLPYSIKRGEVAVIQITLFNFMGNTLTTDVTLFNKNEEIEFVDKSSTDPKRRKKTISVPTHRAQSISFLIKAKKLGEIAIKVEAVNELTSDGLEHLLRVTPESRLYQKTEARFINLPSHNKQEFSINCNIPREADPGSTKIELIIDPPIMASTAQNLESLLTIPTGTGDLNLMTFIPNVVVLDYLRETEKSEPDIKQKATDYLTSGLQNQLKYKHSNGAFGQWNPPKEKPSVFLTALVANAFTTASKHIKIDYEDIIRAFSWIATKQKPDGCFKEDGEMIYAPMQDSSSSFALTAFIVVAVKENENITSRFGAIVEKGVKCLANNFDSLTSMHDIALATYALSLANHPKREKYLNALIQDSIKDNTGRHWNVPLKVEVAAYALLTYLAQHNYLDALPIMEWLNSQRYSTMQFDGVHSTFVALKALGKMAVYTSTRRNDYRVQVSYDKHLKTFDTTNLEPLEVLKHVFPDNARVLNFKIEGIGFGLMQLAYQYHRNIQTAKQNFHLNVDVLSTSSYEIQHLRVCLAFKPPEAYSVSGTTLVEVHLPSGLVVGNNAVHDLSSYKIKKTERVFDNTAMHVYYSGLDTNQVCFQVTAYRKYKIAMHRPSYVVVYDINDMDSFAIRTYEGRVMQLCDICDAEDCTSMNC